MSRLASIQNFCGPDYRLSVISSAPACADESGDVALPAGQTISPRQIDREKSPADKWIVQRVVNQNACEVEVGIGETYQSRNRVDRPSRHYRKQPKRNKCKPTLTDIS